VSYNKKRASASTKPATPKIDKITPKSENIKAIHLQ
jgi:hypothetical protein